MNENDQVEEQDNTQKYYCYILRNHDEKHKNKTYNGYTVNPQRRIRQHNSEIAKGAKYTSAFGNKTWEIYVLICGFPDDVNALQCEWRIRHPGGKKRTKKHTGPIGRVVGLNQVLKLDKWTENSTILNKDLQLTVYIIKEYAELLTDLPDNIKVVEMDDRIDLENV